VLGLLFGSFANVCIYRWPPTPEFPKGRSVVMPGSHCFACKAPIHWYDNVPLLSYVWLRGRCRACNAEFSARYLIVEALCGALFGVAWWFATRATLYYEPFDVRLVRFAIDAAFIFVMVVIAFIDLDHKLILNKITMPSTVIFYGLGLLLPERHWYDGLVGAAVGYGLPWLIGEVYFRVTKREGLGLGDSWLLAVVGALLGWPGVLVALFGGSMIGSVLGIGMLVAGRTLGAGDGDEDEEDDEKEDEREHGHEEGQQGEDKDEQEREDGAKAPSLMKAELPFAPFLVMGALFYLFGADWIHLKFLLLAQ
jgi:leader peptidase (prepilin peptidase)/N-methyltransferase